MKPLPIGISNFKKVVEENYYYIDKTLLIKELLDRKIGVTLLPRPRRFGKTLNLSMLNYFFSNTAKSRHLFENLTIAQYPEIMKHQGKYPVIFLSFKDVKHQTWDLAFEHLCSLIAEVYQDQSASIFSSLATHEQTYFKNILERSASHIDISESLKKLTAWMAKYHQKNVIILLDEYDAPIQAAFQYGYYKDMVTLIRNMFGGVLKDNDALEFSVMTGILRTAKEGIFSGLNNLAVYTILRKPFSEYFGFTQTEIDKFLVDYNLQKESLEIKDWYNGYQFNDTTIYNPWSLLNCIQEKGELMPYWANTSDNVLIKKLLFRAPTHMQMQLEQLVQNKPVRHQIEDAFVYPNVESNETILWSLLVFSGYVTIQQKFSVGDEYEYDLILPNKEVKIIYKKFLEEAFKQPLKLTTMYVLHDALTNGDGELFEKIMQEYLLNSISMFDLPNNEPEKSYHLFVLGLLVTLSDTYEVISNRESGFGRYDIMVIPKDSTKRGLIIEFKRADEKESLETASLRAMEQIHAKKYAQTLRNRGVTNITAFGIAFKGKEVLLKQEEIS